MPTTSSTDVDESMHPLWLGMLMLFAIVLLISIVCCLRVKFSSALRHGFAARKTGKTRSFLLGQTRFLRSILFVNQFSFFQNILQTIDILCQVTMLTLARQYLLLRNCIHQSIMYVENNLPFDSNVSKKMKKILPLCNPIQFLKYELFRTLLSKFLYRYQYLHRWTPIEILKQLENFMQVYAIRVNVEILLHLIVIIANHRTERMASQRVSIKSSNLFGKVG